MGEFVLLFRAGEAEHREAMGTPEHAQQTVQGMLSWIRELQAKGQLEDPGRPLERTGKVIRGSEKRVTDGPYAEANDLVMGFIAIQARDMEEAVALAAGCPILEGGAVVEIRPVMQSPGPSQS